MSSQSPNPSTRSPSKPCSPTARAGADRSARGADLLAQPSAVGALGAAEPPGAALRAPRAAQGHPHRAVRRRRRPGRARGRAFSPTPATPTFPICEGGIAGWEKAGLELFSGVNVPSKAFGEHIEHACHTPNVSARRARRADAKRHRHGRGRQPPVRRIPARLDPERHQRAGRRAGAAHPRHRALARHAGGGQLRRPHPQHHRRAIADQRRPAEQGGGAAQRHDGLHARGLRTGQRQDQALRRTVRRRPAMGESRRRQRRQEIRRDAHRHARRSKASAPT